MSAGLDFVVSAQPAIQARLDDSADIAEQQASLQQSIDQTKSENAAAEAKSAAVTQLARTELWRRNRKSSRTGTQNKHLRPHLHLLHPDLDGIEIHEDHPVKLGGSPPDIANNNAD